MPDYSFACDILNDVYHNGPDWRDRNGSSMVQTARADAKRYYYEHILGKKSEKSTPAMVLGSLLHSLVLDSEERFHREFVQEPEGTERKSKKGKEAAAEFEAKAKAEGRTIFTKKQIVKAQKMAASLRAHPLVAELFNLPSFVTEHAFRWDDPEHGVPCKVKWDFLSFEGDEIIIADVKSSSAFRTWGSVAPRVGYHVQAAHYLEGAEVATGWTGARWRYLFLVVDSEFPHSVAVWDTPAPTLIVGREHRDEGLRKIRRGLDTGIWTDPISEGLNKFVLPESYTRKEEAPQCESPSWL